MEAERLNFCFQSLIEASRELAGLNQPLKILDTFLLSGMGPLGLVSGFAFLANVKTGKCDVACRGVEPADGQKLAENLFPAYEPVFSDRHLRAGAFPRVKVYPPENLPDRLPLPSGMRLLIAWSLDETYSGMAGFGGKISGSPLDPAEEELLVTLSRTMLSILAHAVFTKNIQQLNADLEKRNTELRQALDRADATRRDLDRQLFYLRSHNELISELSPSVRTDALLRTFLLAVIGTFSVAQGFALVLDREEKIVRTACQGPEDRISLAAPDAEKMLFACFDTLEKKDLSGMSVHRVPSPELFSGFPIGLSVKTAMMFVVDRSLMGVIGIGEKITGSPFSREDESILRALTASCMVFLNNARSFETIENLNRELLQRNEALSQTIAELTRARQTISLFEKATDRLKAHVQRIGRIGMVDFLFIFVAALLLGITFNSTSPNAVALIPEILFRPQIEKADPVEAKKLLEGGGAILIDARPREFFTQEHIRGAVNIPASLFEILYLMQLQGVDPEKEIIVYGRTISKRYDEEVAHELSRRGHRKVRVLDGGPAEWKEHG